MLKGYLMPHPPLLVPGVGKGDEVPATRQAFRHISEEVFAYQPQTIVMITPHAISYADYFHIAPGVEAAGDFAAFGAGEIKQRVSYDPELAKGIAEEAQREGLPAGSQGEKEKKLDHGVLVPLHFIQPTCSLVRISIAGFSLLDHYRLGICIRRAAAKLQRRYIIIASGDMSHKLTREGPYGYLPEGPRFDALVQECLVAADVPRLMAIPPALSRAAAECGLRSLAVLLGALDGLALATTFLAYEGTYGVGYLTVAFNATATAPSLLPLLGEDPYVSLARLNVENYVTKGEVIQLPPDLPREMLQNRAGVFVTIRKKGKLRGCIGTIAPTSNSVAEEIIRNSVSSAVHDTRFSPITPAELEDLTYSVDILLPPEVITGLEELDPQRYGVIVSSGRRRGLLLPRLEGITTPKEQVAIALEKGRIAPHEEYTLERFQVVRHGAKE